MSNSKTFSTEIITIAGGTYHEISLHPGNHQVYGSAGRAASALATLGVNVDLYTYADEIVNSVLRERACFENFTLHTNEVRESVIFHYEHGLAEPRIFNYPDTPYPVITVKAPCVLRYGMLEGSAVIDAEYAVYDPQNVTNPEPFTANGSRAKHLALILNRYEAKSSVASANYPTESMQSFFTKAVMPKSSLSSRAQLVHSSAIKVTYPISLPMRQVGSTKLALVTHS